jgi:NADPH-dependent 2,4-dienoyl-CoA reductase/sulfur reductase-like enzyme
VFVIAVGVVAGFFCAQEIRQRDEKNRVRAFLNILVFIK